MNISPLHISNSEKSNSNASFIKQWIIDQALDIGFSDCGFISVDDPLFAKQIIRLKKWLENGYEGQLSFMHNHHELRANPSKLVEGARTIISVRMDYLVDPPKRRRIEDNKRPNNAIIARYARGRDYHKVMRSKLKQLAKRIEQKLPEWNPTQKAPFVFRPFSDSAPIFERAIAEQAGLGWTGKHTLLINKDAGSFFVLGELFISIDLPTSELGKPVSAHCGSCTSCIDICPTQAIIEPYQVNANACVSYLTIEYDGVIPLEYRKGIGNRIFGCDDCQVVCPWNRYAQISKVSDFNPRHSLDDITLIDLWQWTEEEFKQKTQGSPIKRTGYVNFLRNVAIGLGNANKNISYIEQLKQRLGKHNDVLDEHILWAIEEQNKGLSK